MADQIGSYKIGISAEITGDIAGDIEDELGDIPEVEVPVADPGAQGKKYGEKFEAGLKTTAMFSGAALAGTTAFAKALIDDAESGIQALNQSEAVLKSTGNVAGTTADEIVALSEKIAGTTGIDDELIHQAQNLLLTFKNVRNEAGEGNDIFTRATQSLTDMSVAMGSDPKAAALQLGKALNDPIKGISALGRVGIQFSDDQKEVIKSLVETGKVADAQKIILEELDSQFAGSAEAQATASAKIEAQMGIVRGTLGEALLPVYEDFAAILVEDVIPVIGQFGDFLKENPGFAKALAVAMGLLAVAFAVSTTALVLMNLAFLANPITWIVLGIVALIAILIKLGGGMDLLRGDWSAAWQGIKDSLSGAVDWIKGKIDGLWQWLKDIGSKIGDAWDSIWSGGGDAKVEIEAKTSGGDSGGGWRDKIPFLAKGGIVNSPTLSVIGEAGPEAVIPLGKLDQYVDISSEKHDGKSVTVIQNIQKPETMQEMHRATVSAVNTGMLL